MPAISKSLLFLALFAGLCGIFASCSSSGASKLPNDSPLRTTLSVLETAAAQMQKGAKLQKTAVPSGSDSTVPDTGSMEVPGETTTGAAADAASLPDRSVTGPALMEPVNSSGPNLLPTQPAVTSDCERDDSRMELSASKTRIKVGETVVVKVVLKNTGCVSLGLPQYRLAILNSEGKSIFPSDKLEPITHSLAVAPGKSDEAEFMLQAVRPGKATLSAMASFEVHLGYPGPAYWGANSSDGLIIQVDN